MSTETDAKTEKLVIRPHWRAFAVWYLAMAVLGMGPINNPETFLSPLQGFVLAGLICLGIIIKAKTSRLTVTPEMIERRGGLFSRKPLTLPTAELAEVTIIQGFIHRALDVGVLQLTREGERIGIRFWGVAEPRKVQTEIKRLAGMK